MDKSSPLNDPSRLLRYRDSIYASDLLICAITHLDFFTFLRNGPWTFKDIRENLKIESRPTDVLLSLLLALGLIEKDSNIYKLTDLSLKYLVSSGPDSLVPYYGSLKNRPQCLEFYEVLKTGKPAGWSSQKKGQDWLESMSDQQFADSFTTAMDSRGAFLAQKLAEKLDLGRHASLLDVAGGSGIYACSIARRHRHLSATVLEIPPVEAAAARAIESKAMSAWVKVVAGDMFVMLPAGFDLHLFANVFHDWDVDSIKRLAANSFESLSPNGSIAVFDAHLNEDKNGPLSIAEYSCLLMHSTVGRCYSTREIGEILQAVGFTRMATVEVAADRSVIIGNKQ
ncbi:MAG: methyltransferase [Thermodesulfobacteriota bacterium]